MCTHIYVYIYIWVTNYVCMSQYLVVIGRRQKAMKIVLQRVAVCCSVLQCVAACCSVLQCVAVSCNDFYKWKVPCLHQLV